VTEHQARCGLLAVFALSGTLAACSPSPPPAATPDRFEHLQGRVVEQLDSPPYSFLRVKTVDQEVWTAVPVGAYGVGSAVALKRCVGVRNHLIRNHDRRLAVVYFGSLDRKE
jgi:hypothetical protein